MTPEDFFLLLLLAALVLIRVRKLVDALVADAGPVAQPPRSIPQGWTADRPAEQIRSANVIEPSTSIEDARWVDLIDVTVGDD